MQSFDIVKENEVKQKSFRVSQIYDQFDLQEDLIKEEFTGAFDLPEEWNIGIIVGKSGTGKTTIARELFGDYICDFKYAKDSVIDDFEKGLSCEDIIKTLNAVGFSTPKSWVKPYKVLSNGEKMRVDLARALLQNKEIIAFDEYTSVIDREVAQFGSLAIQKTVRKRNKKFIAITCHFDVIEWLEPDWVFNTDTMEFKITRGLHRRRKIKFNIRETKGYWKYFSKYHYLSHSFNKNAKEFTVFTESGKPVGFCSYIHFPCNSHRKMAIYHRIVVMPDYQGLGIGQYMINWLGEYVMKNTDITYFSLITSLKGFARTVMKNKNFKCIHTGHLMCGKNSITAKQCSKYRNTYSFQYIGKGYEKVANNTKIARKGGEK